MDIVEIDNFISVPAGETSVELDVTPLLDILNEGVEEILFEFPFATICVPQSSIALSINYNSNMVIEMPSDESVCLGQSVDLIADVSGGVPPYEFTWTYLDQSSNSNSIFIDVQEGVNQAVFTVTDNCGYSESSSVDLEGLSVDDFSVLWPPNEVFACYGDNSEMSLIFEGGLSPFTFQWYLNGVPTNSPTPYCRGMMIIGLQMGFRQLQPHPYTPYDIYLFS